ncbi:Clp protease ClpP [Lacisediminimonas profundi]|uniref:Clp protease ClpP n=1 Tax=Lacisediminimonas profundi TaxID=2603856 RepID=UPI00124B1830|nr:Clp protease ClpP [Lacisediminimonas profundi]
MPTPSNRNNQESQEPESPEGESGVFRGLARYESCAKVRQLSYYISGEIVEPNYYTELFHTLRSADESDVIALHLNTSGGDFDTGLQLINNMMASRARVVTVLEARGFSMGAFIFLAGDELVVHDNCQLLFHIYSASMAGRGHEQQAEVAAISAWFRRFMTRTCSPFLSDSEISGVLKGSDVWMDSDEISRRLARLHRAREKGRPGRKPQPAHPHGRAEDSVKPVQRVERASHETAAAAAASAAAAGTPSAAERKAGSAVQALEPLWHQLQSAADEDWNERRNALILALQALDASPLRPADARPAPDSASAP